ncbi:MAG: hypothetical protein SGI89_05760 [bacterium]|nr:hypothetical protein [bacterium]
MRIEKQGRSKADLLNSLDKLKDDLKNDIFEYNIGITKINDGYKIKADKKILFIKFHVDADITAGEGYYEITWETNAPEGKVAEAIDKVKDALEKV